MAPLRLRSTGGTKNGLAAWRSSYATCATMFSVKAILMVREKADPACHSENLTVANCTVCNLCEPDSGYDLCLGCYSSGQTCKDPIRHHLYAFLTARPSATHVGPYEQSSGSGRAMCNLCSKTIKQGAIYRAYLVLPIETRNP